MRYLCMSPDPPHVKARLRLRARPNTSHRSRQGTTNRIPNSVSTGKGDLMKGSIDAAVLKQVESEVRHIKAEYRGVVPRSRSTWWQASLLKGSRIPEFPNSSHCSSD